MSTKPSTFFSWATAGVRVAASAGKAAVGFVVRERPPAQILNDIFAQLGAWTQYLSDGVFQGASSFNSTLAVAGATTVGAALVVPDFVFTATNSTETFTKVAHGLLTGDGPVQVANSGGALPTGLVAATDYWIIRTGADTFKLATTLQRAIATTIVNISDDGTGTQTLSDTVNTKRAANLSVNGVVDAPGGYGAIVAPSVTAATANITSTLTANICNLSIVTTQLVKFTNGRLVHLGAWGFKPQVAGAATPVLGDRFGSTSPEGWGLWASGDKLIRELPLVDGDRLLSVNFVYDKQGSAAPLLLEVVSLSALGLSSSITTLASFSDTSSASGLTGHSFSFSYDVAFETIGIRLTSSTSIHFFQSASMVFIRP